MRAEPVAFLELLLVPAVPPSEVLLELAGSAEALLSIVQRELGHWSGLSSHTAKNLGLWRPISGSERERVLARRARRRARLRRTLLPCLEQGHRQKKKLVSALDPRVAAGLESNVSVRLLSASLRLSVVSACGLVVKEQRCRCVAVPRSLACLLDQRRAQLEVVPQNLVLAFSEALRVLREVLETYRGS